MSRDSKKELLSESTNFQVVSEEMLELYNASLQSFDKEMLKRFGSNVNINKNTLKGHYQAINQAVIEQVNEIYFFPGDCY